MKDNDKEKFTFANDIESDIENQPEVAASEQIPESEQSKFENISKQEYARRLTITKTILILVVVSAVVFAFILFWQNDTSLMAICNALWFVVVIQFFIGWILFMNNMNIFTPLIYGVKSYGLMLVGKKLNDDYYTYAKTREENPIPKYYLQICFFASLITAVPAVILLLILI